MNEHVNRRIAVVTGAAQGIGKSIAQTLAEDGYEVISTSRNFKNIQLTEASSGSIHELKLNPAFPDDFKRLAVLIEARFGRLNLLVNNVGGVEKYGTWEELDIDDWNLAFQRNVVFTVSAIKSLENLLFKTDCSSILNVGSLTSKEPGLYNPHYSASKAALSNLTKHLANRFASRGVRVNEVLAGPVFTHSWENLLDSNEVMAPEVRSLRMQELVTAAEKAIPLGRLGKGEDIANIVKFLSGPDATWITGTSVVVDGGKSKSY